MKKINVKTLADSSPFRPLDIIFFSLAAAASFFFMSHPDLWETANHSYVFLECLFGGQFMDFYNVVAQHSNSYYYINGANYNVFIYIIFALWELPVFLFNRIAGLPMVETFIILWAKAVPCFFYAGCGYMVMRLAEKLGLAKDKAMLTAAFFLFNPVAFFSPMVMGQYDTLCLFFTLWALCHYIDGNYTKFSLIIGVGVVCKFFALLIFVPLVLLAEKRLLRIIKYGLMSLWLYIPTTLLFMGRTGQAGGFVSTMIGRMFASEIPSGMGGVALFVTLYAIIVFVSFLYNPKEKTAYMAVYLPMVVFGLLFHSIFWHPQWIVLLMPFVVLTTALHSVRGPWYWLDMVICAGFFLLCFCHYGTQTGAVLFDGGWLYSIWWFRVATAPYWVGLDVLLGKIPFLFQLGPVMFSGAIFANIIFKFPLGRTTLSDRLASESEYDSLSDKTFLYLIFIAGFICMWLVPSVAEFVNAHNACLMDIF